MTGLSEATRFCTCCEIGWVWKPKSSSDGLGLLVYLNEEHLPTQITFLRFDFALTIVLVLIVVRLGGNHPY